MLANSDCTPTSIKTGSRRRCSGLTLVEYAFAIGLGSLVVAAVLAFSLYTGRSFAGMINWSDLESQNRAALDRMSQEIRQAASLTGHTSNSLAFLDGGGKELTYRFLPDQGTLVRARDGQTNTLLTGCDRLSFALFKRNLTNGTYDLYPTSLSDSNAKVVQLSWVCSRRFPGANSGVEKVQTSKIVIRNR